MGGESLEAGFLHVAPVSSAQSGPMVDPADVKLAHSIGKGYFGETWVATLHNATEEFDEFHEVAVKLLPEGSVKDNGETAVARFKALYQKVKDLPNIAAPQGVCVKNGQVCIVSKLYKFSIKDLAEKQPEGKLTLPQFLKYGEALCRSLLSLHEGGVLALNLKPSNFLLDEHDNAVVAQFAIPSLIPSDYPADPRKQQPALWLGTPNYMAPEAWSPLVRGPVEKETDSWSLSCALLEMLTGKVPFAGMKELDIYSAVVLRKERPTIPSGLPPAIARMMDACFEYDYRNRPQVQDILKAFIRPETPFSEGDWVLYVGSDKPELQGHMGVVWSSAAAGSGQGGSVQIALPGPVDPPGPSLLIDVEDPGSSLSAVKDPLALGDTVRVKASVLQPRHGWRGASHESTGPVVGLRAQEGALWVRFPECVDLWQADPADLERVALGMTAGDWVRLKSEWPSGTASPPKNAPSRTGVVHSVAQGNRLRVAFPGLDTLWLGDASSVEPVPSFSAGQFVHIKNSVSEPRFGWPMEKKGRCTKRTWALGKVKSILPNGVLVVKFPGRLRSGGLAFADPEEAEAESLADCQGLAQKYGHLEAMHWSVRPVIMLVGFFIAARLGRAALGITFKASSAALRPDGSESDIEEWVDHPTAEEQEKHILFWFNNKTKNGEEVAV